MKVSTKQRSLTLGRQRRLRAHLKRNLPKQTLALLDTDVCIQALESLILLDIDLGGHSDAKTQEER
jgi:hypothetical protein